MNIGSTLLADSEHCDVTIGFINGSFHATALYPRAVYEREVKKKTDDRWRVMKPGQSTSSLRPVVLYRLPEQSQAHHGNRRGPQHTDPPGQAEARGQGAKAERSGAR